MAETVGDAPKMAPGATRSRSAGALGRLGVWVSEHGRVVTAVWVLLVVGLGIFAPFVDKNLSGAGWQAESPVEAIAAVRMLDRLFVHSRAEEGR